MDLGRSTEYGVGRDGNGSSGENEYVPTVRRSTELRYFVPSITSPTTFKDRPSLNKEPSVLSLTQTLHLERRK